MNDKGKLLTIRETAKYLDLAPGNVRKQCKLGRLKFIMIGKWTYRFYLKDLEDFKFKYGPTKPYR